MDSKLYVPLLLPAELFSWLGKAMLFILFFTVYVWMYLTFLFVSIFCGWLGVTILRDWIGWLLVSVNMTMQYKQMDQKGKVDLNRGTVCLHS